MADVRQLTRGQLRGEIARLTGALLTGWRLCEEVRASGDQARLGRYEDRWEERLGEYRAAYDELRQREHAPRARVDGKKQ